MPREKNEKTSFYGVKMHKTSISLQTTNIFQFAKDLHC